MSNLSGSLEELLDDTLGGVTAGTLLVVESQSVCHAPRHNR